MVRVSILLLVVIDLFASGRRVMPSNPHSGAAMQSDEPLHEPAATRMRVPDEESDDTVASLSDESAEEERMKCAGSEPNPDPASRSPIANMSEEAHLSSSLFEGFHEIAGTLLGSNATRSLTSTSQYCSGSEMQQFRTRFKIMSTNCAETKFEDYKDAAVCSQRNVLFLYPWHDHNNAFCINRKSACYRMNNWYSNACSVHMRRTHSVARAMVELDDFSDDSLKHVVLGGHGSGNSLRWGDGNTCGSTDICVKGARSARFVKKLSRKMHRHGTIFLDSCHAATTDNGRKTDGLSLAQWVANKVGKGIRVFGPHKSFSGADINVRRFIAWYADFDVGGHKYTSGARCPSWADKPYPNSDGDCECPSSHPTCKDQNGNPCPRSFGQTSSLYFLPMCVESWAEDDVTCMCYS